MFTTEFFN